MSGEVVAVFVLNWGIIHSAVLLLFKFKWKNYRVFSEYPADRLI